MLPRMNFLNFFFFLCVVFCVSTGYGQHNDDRVMRYLKKLRDGMYDKRTAPKGDDGAPVSVRVSSYILDINRMDHINMDLTADFYFRQAWYDQRLKHTEGNDEIVLGDEDAIWTPDLFFVEEREGSIHQTVHPNKFIHIKPNGEVLFSIKVSVRFSCPMDLRSYPHDIQKCSLSIESYGFNRTHIDLEWKSAKGVHDPLSATKDKTMLDFDLIEVEPSSDNISFTFGEYSRLQINLTFKRKFGFFATRLYVPFIILVLMSMSSFFIRAEERFLRLALLLVILYLMVSISTDVNSLTPPAPYTKGSDVWIAFCESLVFAAFLEFIVAALISRKDKESDNENANDKGEILLTLDPEAKESSLSTDSLKTPMTKLISKFVARNGRKGEKNLSNRIDRKCRIVFPLCFLLFNVVYWCVYATV